MLRATSFNIRHGEGLDGRIDLERIATVIAETRPDLVALQEIDKGCSRSGNQDLAAELGRRLHMQHRFGRFMPFQGGEYGLAILSRFPITETTRHPLPEGSEPRCALEVQVQIQGLSTPLSFVCVHHDWLIEGVRTRQIQALLKALRARTGPTILAGDFNGERTDNSLRLLATDGWRILDKGGKKTFPSDHPEVEIDFIVIRGFPDMTIEHDVIDCGLASDHRPIHAAFSSPKVSPD